MNVNRRGVLAAALSVVYPGVGHAYLRAWLRALGWLVLSFAAAYFLVPASVLDTYQQALAAGDFGMLASAAVPIDAAVGVLVVRVCNVLDAYLVAVQQQERAPTAADGTPTCPACGKELDEELDFCPWCTTELEWHYPDGRDA